MTDPVRDAVWPDARVLGPGLVGPEVLGRDLFGGRAPTPRWRPGRRRFRPAPDPTT